MASETRPLGLDGVVAVETALSEVDGALGRLNIAGRDLEGWAPNASFEEACALLWSAADPPLRSAADAPLRSAGVIRRSLGEHRVKAFARLSELGNALLLPSGMDALRAAMGHLHLAEMSDGSAADASAHVTAAMSVFAAAWGRTRLGKTPIAPDPAAGHVEDHLRMLEGQPASAAQVRALSTYLLTVSDHGMNASTFAARVVASTQSDMVSSIVAAIGALKGPLHGGAPGPVLDMLDAIGDAARAESFIASELAAGRRIMGMGHRIYRVRDPRAAVLERATLALVDSGLRTERLALARAVERIATGALAAKYPDRKLETNVEFYTAILLDAIGLPREAFSPTFAVGRVIGWSAHVMEQRAKGRLIRPESRYIGAPAS
ncbi:citrate synthase [Pendulispora albinea]|uniref:Citrate synthase n=1 Tax=Pendulispora albinea TaxID=2741071 RepID=A0ABZ2M4W9_9BACT